MERSSQLQKEKNILTRISALKHSSDLKPTVSVEKDSGDSLHSTILSMQKSYGNRYIQELVSGERMPCPELCGRSEPLIASPTRPAAQFKPHSCDSCVFHPQRSVKRASAGSSNPSDGIQLQAKLKIGQPGDVYEQEADKVADTVLQRQCITPEFEEEEEVLQMKQTSGTIESDQDVIGQILQHKGSGRPLEPDVREFMESRFGYDFGDVKIHTDSHAAETSEKLGAEAFTVGRDVYFGRGRYRPISLKGKKLIAHELVHVLQQRGKGMMLQSTPAMTQPGDPYETEADRIALPVVEMPGLSPYYPIEVHSLHSASPAFISRAVPVALIVLGAFAAAAACALAFFIAGMRKTGKSDKWKHCWVSCKIGTWCPPIPVISQVISALVGAAKEVADIVIGAAQMRDFIANLEGIECSARYFTSCESCCNAKGL